MCFTAAIHCYLFNIWNEFYFKENVLHVSSSNSYVPVIFHLLFINILQVLHGATARWRINIACHSLPLCLALIKLCLLSFSLRANDMANNNSLLWAHCFIYLQYSLSWLKTSAGPSEGCHRQRPGTGEAGTAGEDRVEDGALPWAGTEGDTGEAAGDGTEKQRYPSMQDGCHVLACTLTTFHQNRSAQNAEVQLCRKKQLPNTCIRKIIFNKKGNIL